MRLLKFLILFLIFASFCHAQWEKLNQGLPFSLGKIDFINENTGWILGNNHNFLKTTNGGQTWSDLPLEQSLSIYDFNFISDSLGWAFGGNLMLKTSDGGQSWQQLTHTQTSVSALFPASDNTLFAILNNSTLIKSIDAGKSWPDSFSFGENIVITDMWFFNKDTGIVAGGYSNEPYEGLFIKHIMAD